MTTLVVAAHPDDEVLGCGGTVAKFAATGEDVHLVILGEGSTSRFNDRSVPDPALVADLRSASDEAAARLGARSTRNLGLPDNRFDSVDLLDVVKAVEAVVAEVDPTRALTHHGGDLNIDHRVTNQAVLAATRPLPGSRLTEVLAFEVLSSSEWAFGATPAFRPSVYVDVTATIATKQHALEAYAAEMRGFPHPRSAIAVDALARLRGSTVGVDAAEAFELLWARR